MITHGWRIQNGAGLNEHVTVKALRPYFEELPAVPPGYTVLIAPVDRKRPLGLRCALVRECTQEDADPWVLERFGFPGKLLIWVLAVRNDRDESTWFITQMAAALNTIPRAM